MLISLKVSSRTCLCSFSSFCDHKHTFQIMWLTVTNVFPDHSKFIYHIYLSFFIFGSVALSLSSFWSTCFFSIISLLWFSSGVPFTFCLCWSLANDSALPLLPLLLLLVMFPNLLWKCGLFLIGEWMGQTWQMPMAWESFELYLCWNFRFSPIKEKIIF